MQMLQGQDDLSDVDPDLALGEVIPLVQVCEHLSSTHVVYTHTTHTHTYLKTPPTHTNTRK